MQTMVFNNKIQLCGSIKEITNYLQAYPAHMTLKEFIAMHLH